MLEISEHANLFNFVTPSVNLVSYGTNSKTQNYILSKM
jgi:hypothetical protein